MKEYLIRGKLEFEFDFEDRGNRKHLRSPDKFPIWIDPFKLDQSPNIEFYLDGLGLIDLDRTRQEYSNWQYPVSLLHVESRLQVADKVDPRAKADEAFESLECLFRLFQPGEISIQRHTYVWNVQGKDQSFVPFFPGRPVKPVPATLYKRPPYPLDDDVLSEFIQFFNKYWSLIQNNPPSHLTIALSRFNSSYERLSLADRLIDLVVALEAMFSERKSRSISYNVAKRCAGWLHSAEDDRLAALRFVKKMYNDRSDVVHGEGQVKLCKKQVDDLEDIARASLLKFLDCFASQGKVPHGKEIDSLIMAGKL